MISDTGRESDILVARYEKVDRPIGMSVRSRLLFAIAAALGLAVFAVIVAGRAHDRSSRPLQIFEVEMRASGGTVAQLFWAADLRFVDQRSMRVPLRPASEGFQRLLFPIPSRGVRWLRFHPTDAPAEILIRGVRILALNGQVQQTLDPQSFKPTNQIASITRQGDVTRVVTTPAANEPFLLVALGCLDSPSLAKSLSLVTPAALVLASATTIVLLTACVVVIGIAAFRDRAAFRQVPGVGLPDGMQLRSKADGVAQSWWLAALWMAALFLVVFAASLLLMREHPLTVPFWDQWDAEARGLYIPFDACSLAWGQMFQLHNEHRVFFTRLLALDLLVANGQWDPRLQQVVNAAMHALTSVVLAAALWIASERRRLDLVVFSGAMAFALPSSWENALMGFQSAFYFQELLSILALWLMTAYRAGSGPWYLGLSCAVCGLFTAAGGVLTPLAIILVVALKLANDRREWRESLVTVGAAGAVLAAGIALASPPLAHHEVLRAKTLGDFAGALGRNLAWPWIGYPGLSVVMWLPIGALLLVAMVRRRETTGFERFIVGLGAWAALQAGAVAYGRGAGAPSPAPRYQDFLSLGFVANTMALVAFLDRARRGTAARGLAIAALVGWLLVSVIGVDHLATRALADLKVWRQYWSAHAVNVRRFIITDDRAEFVSKQPLIELPYPDAQSLVSVLQDPFIRRILPETVREPVHVEPHAVTNDAFVPEGWYPATPRDPLEAHAWGSFSAQGHRAQGRFESLPVAACRGSRLRFQMSGYLGRPGHYMALREIRSGRDLPVRPAEVAELSWIETLVPCPDGPFAFIAVDANPDSWFAFREPVEVAWASPVAESLIAASAGLLFVALAMAVLAARWT
jgi:hypothetical protein